MSCRNRTPTLFVTASKNTNSVQLGQSESQTLSCLSGGQVPKLLILMFEGNGRFSLLLRDSNRRPRRALHATCPASFLFPSLYCRCNRLGQWVCLAWTPRVCGSSARAPAVQQPIPAR